jgi:aspartyl-tRNA(Asn)/glutamyl-tRNA(Gln) amidotransferase subunit A
MISADILYLGATELAKRIQSKSLSPLELTKAYLDRSEKLASKLNAYARLTPEIALEQAAAAEKEIGRGHYRGPLHGIPYAAKDLLATKGIPTLGAPSPLKTRCSITTRR